MPRVTRDRAPPQLQQTTPTDNATNVAVNANLILTFNETVKAGAGTIEIRNVNGTLVQSIAVTDTSKVTFAGNQMTLNPGSDLSPDTSYYLTFASGVVSDLANNAFAGIASPTVFNFSTVSGPPSLVSMIPADNSTGAKPWSDIVLFFNEEVKAGSGNIEIHKSDGSLVTAISITDTFQVQFADHVVTLNPHADLDWSTGYYVTFAPAVIRDLQNNSSTGATSPTQFNFITGPNDTDTGPLLVSATPSDNSANVNVGANIGLTFSEPIKLGNENGTIRVYNADGTFAKFIYLYDPSQVTISGNTLTVNPTTDLLSQTAYYVTLAPGNILGLDNWGFAGLNSPTSLNFVTGTSTDVSAPQLSSTLPSDNAVDLPQDFSLIMYFNEGVKAGTGNIEIHRASDDSLVEAIAVTNTIRAEFYENRVLLFPTAPFDWGTEYYIMLGPGTILDYVGNSFGGISSPTAFSFTTRDNPATSPPILNSTSPDNGSVGLDIDGHIRLFFSEFVQAGTGTIEIRRASDNALVTSIDINDATQVTISQTGVTLNPHINLDPHTEYYVLVPPGAIEDLAGNDYAGITSPTGFRFTVGPLVPPPPLPSGGVIVVGGFFPDTTPPSLTGISPADDSSNVPNASNFILTFNEKVKAGAGDLEIHKLSDGSLFKSIALSDTSQVTFSDYTITINPNVNLGLNTGYYVVLKPGAVQDLSGNAYAGFAGTTGFNFTTASSPDTTPPNLTFSFHLSFDFDEPIVRGTGTIEIRRLLDGSLFDSVAVTDTSKVIINGDMVGVTPNIPLEDASAYYVTIGAGVFKDLAGNAFGGTTTPYFTTYDQNDPILLSMLPGIDATNVGVGSNIVLTFNEPVMPGWYGFSLRVGGQVKFSFDVNDASQVTYSGNTVIINPTVDLQSGTTYTFSIATNAVEDLNGNGYFGREYNFTTAGVGGGAPPGGGLTLTGNAQGNTLVGGTGNDTITGLGGKDILTGAAGVDTFVYGEVSHSTSRTYDTITDFNTAADVIDLWFAVTGVDASVSGGSLGSRRFDPDLASAVDSTKLAAHHAVLYAPGSGVPAGSTLLIVDANGVAGYQAGADVVILLGAGSTNLGSLTAADFV